VVWAGDILAREPISKQARSTAQRIVALPAWVADKLATHKAPYRVACWVAWGDRSELEPRADLALLLRHARPGKGWPDARHLKVAFDVYLQARAARLGGLGTLVSDVPVDRYLAAIGALPKRRRGASRRLTDAAEESSAPPAAMTEDDVLRALVAARRPRRPRPPAIRLRTTPLCTADAQAASPSDELERAQAASPSDELERAQAEIARLRALREDDELEVQRFKGLLRRDNERLTARIELLERELRAHSAGPPTWLVGLGGVAAGALVTEVMRRGVDLLQAGEVRAQEDRPTVPATGSLDGEALLGRLLPVFDNLARAQQHAEGAPAAAIAEGLRMMQDQLDEALARSGVERVPTVGQLFDPSRHAAVEHVEAPEPAGTVLRELLPGYMAGGRLLRAASVVVSKGQMRLGG